MYILDYLTSKRPSASQRYSAPHSSVEDVADAQGHSAQLVKQPSAQPSRLPPYLQLYKRPTHGRTHEPTAQHTGVGGALHAQPRDESRKPAIAQVNDAAVLRPAAETPDATPGPAATLTARTSEPQPAAAPASTPSSTEAAASSGAAATDAAAAPPAGRLGLKECGSRACAGVLDTFKRAVAKGGSAGSSSLGSPQVAAASAIERGAATTPSPPPSSVSSSPSATASAASDASSGGSSGSIPSGSGSPSSSSGGGEEAAEWPRGVQCPPDSWQLGRASWTFLHSVAAHYPDAPSPRQQQLMRGLMEALAEFYPCHVCAEHLREQFRGNPPRVATAAELNSWLCGIHNEVNEMLGKPKFDCARVMERWRDGPEDGWCD